MPKCEVADLTTDVLANWSQIIFHTVIRNFIPFIGFLQLYAKVHCKIAKISRTVGKNVNVINSYSEKQPVGGITDLPNACKLGKESNFFAIAC